MSCNNGWVEFETTIRASAITHLLWLHCSSQCKHVDCARSKSPSVLEMMMHYGEKHSTTWHRIQASFKWAVALTSESMHLTMVPWTYFWHPLHISQRPNSVDCQSSPVVLRTVTTNGELGLKAQVGNCQQLSPHRTTEVPPFWNDIPWLHHAHSLDGATGEETVSL